MFVDALEPRRLMARAAFDWSMPDRFGLDENGDGRIDLPNTAAYAEPGLFEDRYTVNFQAPTERPNGVDIVDYAWTVYSSGRRGFDLPTRNLTGAAPTAELVESTYRVTLFTLDAAGVGKFVQKKIVVSDVLVVSLGDSYASGEGNPEVPSNVRADVQWAGSPDGAVAAEHQLAHRSTFAGPAQAALELERSDPHSSVTFISLANSGATVANGLFGPSPALDDPDVSLPAQVDRLPGLIGNRAIDFLCISIGGNDVGFVDLGLDLLSQDSTDEQFNVLGITVQARLEALTDDLADVNGRVIATLGHNRVGQVLVTEYPDLTGNDAGRVGEPVLEFFGGQVTRAEGAFVRNVVLKSLNKTLATSARQNGWRFVGGISRGFRKHGLPANEDRWFVTIAESLAAEGTVFGAIHPNAAGHAFVAKRLLTALR
jgi:lysophospholipase L1-like esterase